jgi:hypothetical protein
MTGLITATHHVQAMVDALAEQLGRSVVVNDPAVRIVCASRHYGDEDEVRIRAVLQRDAGAEVGRFVLAQGVARWHEPHVLEGDEALGLKSRLCVPLHGPGWLMGILMVIDADHTLTSAEVEQIDKVSHDIAGQMYSDFLANDPTYLERQQALRALLGRDGNARRSAVDYFDEHGSLADAEHVAITAIVVASPAQADTPVDVALRVVIGTVARARSRSWEVFVDNDRAVLLQLRDQQFDSAGLRDQGARIVAELGRLLGPASHSAIGICTNDRGRDDAWLTRRHADVAVRAATRRARGDDAVVFWDDLGVDGILLQLPNDSLVWSTVPEPVQALAERGGSNKLLHTARAFLDHGGSISRTASALHMHRTSLYYRLDQIKAITGLDLDDGSDRLLLHVGLRLLDLLPSGADSTPHYDKT